MFRQHVEMEQQRLKLDREKWEAERAEQRQRAVRDEDDRRQVRELQANLLSVMQRLLSKK